MRVLNCVHAHRVWQRACNSSFSCWLHGVQSLLAQRVLLVEVYANFDADVFHYVVSFEVVWRTPALCAGVFCLFYLLDGGIASVI